MVLPVRAIEALVSLGYSERDVADIVESLDDGKRDVSELIKGPAWLSLGKDDKDERREYALSEMASTEEEICGNIAYDQSSLTSM